MMTVELIICVWGLPKTALRRDKRAGFKHITPKSSLEGKQATQRSLPTKPGMGTRWVAPQKHSMRLVEGPEAMSQLSKEIHARGPLPWRDAGPALRISIPSRRRTRQGAPNGCQGTSKMGGFPFGVPLS